MGRSSTKKKEKQQDEEAGVPKTPPPPADKPPTKKSKKDGKASKSSSAAGTPTGKQNAKGKDKPVQDAVAADKTETSPSDTSGDDIVEKPSDTGGASTITLRFANGRSISTHESNLESAAVQKLIEQWGQATSSSTTSTSDGANRDVNKRFWSDGEEKISDTVVTSLRGNCVPLTRLSLKADGTDTVPFTVAMYIYKACLENYVYRHEVSTVSAPGPQRVLGLVGQKFMNFREDLLGKFQQPPYVDAELDLQNIINLLAAEGVGCFGIGAGNRESMSHPTQYTYETLVGSAVEYDTLKNYMRAVTQAVAIQFMVITEHSLYVRGKNVTDLDAYKITGNGLWRSLLLLVEKGEPAFHADIKTHSDAILKGVEDKITVDISEDFDWDADLSMASWMTLLERVRVTMERVPALEAAFPKLVRDHSQGFSAPFGPDGKPRGPPGIPPRSAVYALYTGGRSRTSAQSRVDEIRSKLTPKEVAASEIVDEVQDLIHQRCEEQKIRAIECITLHPRRCRAPLHNRSIAFAIFEGVAKKLLHKDTGTYKPHDSAAFPTSDQPQNKKAKQSNGGGRGGGRRGR